MADNNTATFDAYSPAQIAAMVEANGVKKANLPFLPMSVLGFLAGAYIGLGGMLYTLAITDTTWGLGPTRIFGGIAFSLGLIMVVIGGAELFTGNTMITMSWAQKKVSTPQLLRNWLIIYLSNFIGSVLVAWLVHSTGVLSTMGGGKLLATVYEVAEKKVALPFDQIFFRGILCNILVCMGVWLAMGSRSAGGKIGGIVFPVAAFVAMGFEHCVANMYLIPVAMMEGAPVTPAAFIHNLVPATLGNIVGGGVLVALVYWVVYVRQSQKA